MSVMRILNKFVQYPIAVLSANYFIEISKALIDFEAISHTINCMLKLEANQIRQPLRWIAAVFNLRHVR